MDLVTFGEAMVRLTPPPFQRIEQAHSFDAYVGGGELNVAVAAARLGILSRWVSRLPQNALGRMIAGKAREQGVDAQIQWSDHDRAGLYFAELGAAPRASSVLYDRAASAISMVRPGIDWPTVFAGARWYHVSGITPALSESAAQVTAESLVAAKKAGLTVSYDLNYRSKLWSGEKARAVQEPFMEHVDVLITTEEDTRVVFGLGADADSNFEQVDSESYADVARALEKRFDLSAVAITLRENPRVLLNSWTGIVSADGRIHRAPRYEVEVVDRIGAGDAFSAGLIVSRLENHGWEDAVRFATATSALKHSIPGDFCLVTRGEVEQLLRGASLRVSR
jgi:2-dehydro-3-deoxygluconokinase